MAETYGKEGYGVSTSVIGLLDRLMVGGFALRAMAAMLAQPAILKPSVDGSNPHALMMLDTSPRTSHVQVRLPTVMSAMLRVACAVGLGIAFISHAPPAQGVG
jgi:hypothetical protein